MLWKSVQHSVRSQGWFQNVDVRQNMEEQELAVFTEKDKPKVCHMTDNSEKNKCHLPRPILTSVSSVSLQMKSSSCRISELLIASIIMSVICIFSIPPPRGLLAPLLSTDSWSHDPLLGLSKFVSLADCTNSSHDALLLMLSSGDLEYWWSVSQTKTEACFGSSKLSMSIGVSIVRISQLVWAHATPCSGRSLSFRSPMPKMSGKSRSFYKIKIIRCNLWFPETIT